MKKKKPKLLYIVILAVLLSLLVIWLLVNGKTQREDAAQISPPQAETAVPPSFEAEQREPSEGENTDEPIIVADDPAGENPSVQSQPVQEQENGEISEEETSSAGDIALDSYSIALAENDTPIG